MRFDLHVHTTFSGDSRLDYQEILTTAKSKGLDGVCITDHQNMDITRYYPEGLQEDGLVVIFGMEYETTEGDFLIFGPFETLPKSLAARNLLSIVQAQGGVAVAAHPFRDGRLINEALIRENACNAIESVNGRNTYFQNHRTRSWLKKYSLAQVGGSDAHTLDELARVVTCFNAPILNRADLIAAIKNGSGSPFLNPPSILQHPIQTYAAIL